MMELSWAVLTAACSVASMAESSGHELVEHLAVEMAVRMADLRADQKV